MYDSLTIQDFEDPDYDPFTALSVVGGEGEIEDIYPLLARLRRQSPVYEGDIRFEFGLKPDLTLLGIRQVAVLGYKEVLQVLQDQKTYSNKIYNKNLGIYFGQSVTTMDQPEHYRYRRYFQRAFSPRLISRWGDVLIPRTINRLIDGFADRGRAELVSEFTLHFPFHFIHELLELPIKDRDVFHRLAFGQISIPYDERHGMEAAMKLKEYLTQLVHHRRDNPISDVDFISEIAKSEIDGEYLPDDIVISFFRQLMNAGGDTSYHGFSSVLAGLLTHPEQLEAVRKDRALIPQALEEGLRWNCPVIPLSRTPAVPVELGGVHINPGDHIAIILGAANRDETVFANPDEYDIFRKPGPKHVAFGGGAHICIGQHLARLEMTAALNALLDRFPGLRADPDYPPPHVQGFSLRGPHAVHVRFD